GAAISVVALGILTNLATNFMPEDALPPLWLIWAALIIVSLIFIIFSFWQDRIPEHEARSFLSSPDSLSSSSTLRQRYLRYLIDAYQFLEFKGIIQFEKLPLRMSLEKVYVNLWAQPELPTGETLHQELRLAGRKLVAEKKALLDDELELLVERAKPVQVEEALTEHAALVILGDPGSGKSTLLKHLALQAAMNFEREQRLPILLPLAAYAHALQTKPQLSLREFLPEFYKGMQEFPENPAALFYDALETGKALVLLDGLDEVHNPDERSRVVHHVKNFCLNYRHETARALGVTGQATNKFVITSRIVGYREAPLEAEGVFHLTLLDFNKEQITQFAGNWCRTYEIAQSGDTPKATRDAEQEKNKLLKAIFGNPGVEKLAANPLLLTILALIHRQGTELPNRRAELYELYLTTLIKTWNRARNIAGIPVGSMDDKETVKILAPLAYWMHANRPSGTARRIELEREITRHFTERRKLELEEAEKAARRFLDDVRQFSGLLAERGPDAYGFVHLTFEEYLAARHIVFQGQVNEQKSLELIRKHAYDPGWREVILLTLGYLGLIANEEEKTALFVRGLLNDEPPADHLGENVELAGSALKDIGRVSVGEDCYKEVIDRLLNTMVHSAPTIIVRAKCGDVLGELGDPRLDQMEWCEVPEGEFLMGASQEEFTAFHYDWDEWIRNLNLVRGYEDIDRWAKSCYPQHRVFVKPFKICKYPVTNKQFRQFILAGGYQDKRWWEHSIDSWQNLVSEIQQEKLLEWPHSSIDRKTQLGTLQGCDIDNRPVVGCTWFEATAFCKWLTAQLHIENELDNATLARLPTEAEWEKAARGIEGRYWPWGYAWQDKMCNTFEAKIYNTTCVGLWPESASIYGVLDMAGNVWEWCNSILTPYPYRIDDGREAQTGEDQRRVLRGGSWLQNKQCVRCIFRARRSSYKKYNDAGFRVVIGPKLE
ncbi:SUMF1/EgtB/PvdO family nonheme iron enzyme, partial [candidate division KSB1 bacterium]|nr:SUMF1/EgtB/PvdO family nonheme iron enzyme [candidate division KSB1 bacterium]